MDTLDKYMKDKMERLDMPMTVGEKEQFMYIQDKNKNDEQWRRMRVLFDKPLAHDNHIYKRGPVTEEDQERYSRII